MPDGVASDTRAIGTGRSIGWIDCIDETSGLIHGWAYAPNEPAVQVNFSYDGTPCGAAVANGYRPDVEAAGIGSATVGFAVPLPCERARFRPDLFEAHCRDGTPLGRTREFLAAGDRAFRVADIDLLSSPITKTAFLELTSRCNLRCVYCAVSQPTYAGQDLDSSVLAGLIHHLVDRKVGTVQVSGHGETTLVPGWHHRVNALAAAGLNLAIITNFARLLSEEELVAMAHIHQICISLDTHRPEVLRKIRRHVSLGNILTNMFKTAGKAAELGLPKPQFGWSCVITDKTAFDLLGYVRFGLAAGVDGFQLCNLTKYPDVDDAENVNHITTLPTPELKRFAESLDEAREIVRAAGRTFEITAGLTETLQRELATRGQ